SPRRDPRGNFPSTGPSGTEADGSRLHLGSRSKVAARYPKALYWDRSRMRTPPSAWISRGPSSTSRRRRVPVPPRGRWSAPRRQPMQRPERQRVDRHHDRHRHALSRAPVGARLTCAVPESRVPASMPAFSSFDTRGYRTVSAREGYGLWSPSYEETVKDEM